MKKNLFKVVVTLSLFLGYQVNAAEDFSLERIMRRQGWTIVKNFELPSRYPSFSTHEGKIVPWWKGRKIESLYFKQDLSGKFTISVVLKKENKELYQHFLAKGQDSVYQNWFTSYGADLKKHEKFLSDLTYYRIIPRYLEDYVIRKIKKIEQ